MITNLMEAIRNGYNSNGKYQSFLVGMTGKDARDILQEYEDMQKELADLRAAQRPDSARQVEFARGVIDEQYTKIHDLERDNTQLRQARTQLIKTTQDLMGVIRERDHEIADLKRKLASVTEMNESNDALLAEKSDLLEDTVAENGALRAQIRGLQMQVEALESDATKTAEARELDNKTMANLNRALISRNREIEGLRYVLNEKSKAIDEIAAVNEQLSAKVAAYAQTIAEQNEANKKLSQRLLETNSRDNERIRELQARIERARTGDNTSIHQLRFEVRRLTEVEIGLRKKLQKKDKIIEGLQKGLRAKSEVIRNLNARLGHMAEPDSLAIVIHSLTEED